MIVPVLPGISIKNLLTSKQSLDVLPFPLNRHPEPVERPQYYFYARNGIYHGLKHFNIKPGDEVLMPELNSTIEPQVVRALGAIPVFYKIKTCSPAHQNPCSPFEDFTPDWDDVRSKLTSRTKFFHLIHYLGIPNDIDTTLEFCEKHNLIFFEDAAYGFLSGHQQQTTDNRQQNKNDPLTKTPAHLHTLPLGSFGHFSILCPRKTIPIPNGAAFVINKKTDNMLPSNPHASPLQVRYSSLWDWSWLLRNHPEDVSKHRHAEGRSAFDGKSETSKSQSLPSKPPLPIIKSLRQFVATHKGYVHHDLGEFDLNRLNWGMTKMAYNQLFKFDYPSIIKTNLENYTHVRDFCMNKGWDIFPREIRPGTVPNAILLRITNQELRIREIQKHVIPNSKYIIRNDGNNANTPENPADIISSAMLHHGVQLARPWHWNENLTVKKDIPSVDAYVGRGLILPIHYQLNREHLDYYLSLLASVLR